MEQLAERRNQVAVDPFVGTHSCWPRSPGAAAFVRTRPSARADVTLKRGFFDFDVAVAGDDRN